MPAPTNSNSSGGRAGKLKPSGVSRCRVCFRKFFAFLVSNVGLCVLVVAYAFVGALIFGEIEGKNDAKIVEKVNELRNRTINNLWNITLSYNVFHTDQWNNDVSIEMKIFQRELMNAINNGYEGKCSHGQERWSFPVAFLFSLTVISTIGYGNVIPRTDTGKLVTIIYAIIGIPLMLLYLTNIGDLLAKSFRYVYGRLCSCKQDPKAILVAAEKRCAGIGCGGGCSSGSGHGNGGRNAGSVAVGLSGGAIDGNSMISTYLPPNYSTLSGTGSSILNGSAKNGSSRYKNASSTSGVMCSTPNHHDSRPMLESIFEGSETITREFDIISMPSKDKVRVPITLCFIIMSSYICGGGLLFSLWENWKFLDGAYFCFVTLSTIGFGDLVPGFSASRSDSKLAICSLYLLAGMALLAMCFKLMQEEVIHKIRLFGMKIGIINDSDNHDISGDFN